MKHIITVLLAAGLLGACADKNATPAAETGTETQQKTYRVASQLNYPPFHFLDNAGKPTGFEIDVLQAAAKAGGFEISITNTPRSSLERTLADGTADLWSSTISVKPERQEVMDFSQPFLYNDSKMIAVLDNEQNKNLQTPQDFQGKKLAVTKYSKSAIDLAAKLTGSRSNVVVTDSYYLSMKEVYGGRADGTIENGYVLAYQAKQQPELKVRQIMVENEKKDFAFAVKKGNTALLEPVNKGLQTIKADGTYDKLFEKWFGQTPQAQ